MRGIKEIRKAKARRYSRESVAKAMGVSPYILKQIEESPERITAEQAARAAEYLECDATDLFLSSKPTFSCQKEEDEDASD